MKEKNLTSFIDNIPNVGRSPPPWLPTLHLVLVTSYQNSTGRKFFFFEKIDITCLDVEKFDIFPLFFLRKLSRQYK